MKTKNKIKSFGYEHLRRTGWSDGKGLGKTESGLVDPIKVNLKHDTQGLGHDMAREFTNQWWDHVFNKAAAKVTVDTSDDGVKVQCKELSKQQKDTLKQKILYGRFIKGTTLDNGQENHVTSHVIEEDTVKPAVTILTDEELLQACGGRTAHKGARHGLKASGKLSRVEQQDLTVTKQTADSREKKKKKKRKEEDRLQEIVEEPQIITSTELESEISPKHKKKKMSKKSYTIINETNQEDDSGVKHKTKKKRRLKSETESKAIAKIKTPKTSDCNFNGESVTRKKCKKMSRIS